MIIVLLVSRREDAVLANNIVHPEVWIHNIDRCTGTRDAGYRYATVSSICRADCCVLIAGSRRKNIAVRLLGRTVGRGSWYRQTVRVSRQLISVQRNLWRTRHLPKCHRRQAGSLSDAYRNPAAQIGYAEGGSAIPTISGA